MKATTNTPKTTKLEKSIEVSKRRISEYEKKIEMYRTRFEKNNKYGLDLSALRFDYDGTKETHQAIAIHNDEVERGWYNVYVKELGENDGFWAYCKVKDAASYFIDNHYNLKREQKNLAELESQMAKANAIINAQKDSEENPQGLRKVLIDALADYKVYWFDYMRKWHSKTYDKLWAMQPMWAGWVKKYKKLMSRWYNKISHYYGHHITLCNRLERKAVEYRKQLSKRELSYDNKDEYMVEVEKDLIDTWKYLMNKLVAKCEKFNIDLDNVVVLNPMVEEKGFSVLIRDGKPRVIDVRTIWAAEYSDYVAPHTRYIITERKTKR